MKVLEKSPQGLRGRGEWRGERPLIKLELQEDGTEVASCGARGVVGE